MTSSTWRWTVPAPKSGMGDNVVDLGLAMAARRGLPWRCRRGHHKMALITAAKIDGMYKRTRRCRRCGLVRYEERPR